MMELNEPKFQWGQKVRNLIDLMNDGSFPDSGEDELLVPEGAIGEIVQTGIHQESKTAVYIVEFPEGMIVGCLETELEAA